MKRIVLVIGGAVAAGWIIGIVGLYVVLMYGPDSVFDFD